MDSASTPWEDVVCVEGSTGVETCVKLTSAGLSVADASDWATLDGTGATCVFVGTTRDTFEGKAVVRLEYEAYGAMAVGEVLRMCAAARARWPDLARVAVHHRVGVVPVREPSVVIAVSSPRRVAALAALPFLIDTLKASVPIWKKEVYADDSAEWKANAESAGGGVAAPA